MLTPAQLDHYSSEGYLIFENLIPKPLIDCFNRDFDQYLSDSDQVEEAKQPFWRRHALHARLPAIRNLFYYRPLHLIAQELLGMPCNPSYSITFMRGSQQDLHQDQYVFAVDPPHALCGVWIALEDITEESGPLVYYPKSHTLQHDLFPEYPLKNVKNSGPHKQVEYGLHMEEVSKNYERKTFLAKKGDTLIWTPKLLHGGQKGISEDSTRRSFVVHYTGVGCDVSHKQSGPFLW